MSDTSSPPTSLRSDFVEIVEMSPLSEPEILLSDTPPGMQISESLVQAVDHIRFFFEDGSLRFLVENIRYSIHKTLVRRHSLVWLKELDHQPELTALANVTAVEMDALLSILYPSDVCRRDISSVEEWTAVLRLSTRWSITTFQELALQKLETLASTLDKLVIARQLNISSWVEPAICTLCLRPDPLTLAEAQRLEMTDVVAIFIVQQRVQTSKIPATAEAAVSQFRALLNVDGESLRDPISPDIRTSTTPVEEVDPAPSSSNCSSQAVKNGNLAVTFDQESLVGLLRRRKFEEAVESMSEDRCENIIQVLVDWTNTSKLTEDISEAVRQPVNSSGSTYDISPVVEELVRRSARDCAFIPTAVQVLSEWRRLARGAANSIYLTLRSAVECILSRPMLRGNTSDNSPNPEYSSWEAKYVLIVATRETFHNLSKEELSRRCGCALEFICAALEYSLVGVSFVANKLPTTPDKAAVLFETLSVLGPVFDSSIEGSEALDSSLDRLRIPRSVRASIAKGKRTGMMQSARVSATGALQLPVAGTWLELLLLRELKWKWEATA